MRAVARAVPLGASLRRWIVAVVAATHPDCPQAPEPVRRFVRYGVSPRGAQAVVTAAKIRAATEGRSAVCEADVRAALYPALRHRLILNLEGQAECTSPDRLIDAIVETIRCPDSTPNC